MTGSALRRSDGQDWPSRGLSRAVRFAVLSLVLSCSGGKDGGPTAPKAPPPTLTSLTVSLSASTVAVGQSVTATATGTDQNGAPIATGAISWSTGSPTIATVNASGAVNGITAGQTSVIASAAGRQGQQSLTVIPAPVATVSISPAAVEIRAGTAQQLSVVLKDVGGNVLSGRAVTWESSDTSRVRVSNTGMVTAVAPGVGEVTARSEGRAGAVSVVVLSSATVSAAASGTTVTLPTGTVVTIPPATVAAGAVVSVTERPRTDASGAADDGWRLTVRIESVSGAEPTGSRTLTVQPSNVGAAQAGKTAYWLVTDSGSTEQRFATESAGAAGSAVETRNGGLVMAPLVVAYTAQKVVTLVVRIQQGVAQNASNCGSVPRFRRATGRSALSGPRAAVILVHGWQPFARCRAADDASIWQRAASWATGYADLSDYEPQPMWEPLINALVNDATLNPDVDVWVYRYPTTLSPSENAADLWQRIGAESALPKGADKLTVVAHSMGGLVARYLDKLDSEGRVAGIVTMGTPHRGSELAEGSIAQFLMPSPGLDALRGQDVASDAPLPASAPLHAIRGGMPCSYFTALGAGLSGEARLVALLGSSSCRLFSGSADITDGIVLHSSSAPTGATTTGAAASAGTIVTHLDIPANATAIAGAIAKLRTWLAPVLGNVNTVTIAPPTTYLSVASSRQFVATLVGAAGNTLAGRVVTWSSSNSGVAMVDAVTGVVTAVAVGIATITATSEGKSGAATVTVGLLKGQQATTDPADEITASSARLHGRVLQDGGAYSVWFEYGTSPTLVGASTTGTGTGPGSNCVGSAYCFWYSDRNNLASASTYYFRIVTSDVTGVSRGAIRTFTTAAPPVISSLSVTLIGLNHANCVASGNNGSLYRFQFAYVDPDGDVVSTGDPVTYSWAYRPSNTTGSLLPTGLTVTGTSASGTMAFSICNRFGANASHDASIVLRDRAGHESNALAVNIPKPTGANLVEMSTKPSIMSVPEGGR